MEAAAESEARRLRPGGLARATPGPGTRDRAPRDARADGAPASSAVASRTAPAEAGTVATRRPARREKLSKDAYRRQKAAVEAELTRLNLRKNHLELAMGDASIQANFVELRRVTSELADVETALAAAEDTWLELEERAP